MKALCSFLFLLLTGCSNNTEKSNTKDNTAEPTRPSTTSSVVSQSGIVGEWEQQYTAFDKNGNYQLEASEKTPAATTTGFNWFKFEEDGTCLRDKQIKFEGTYEIIENNGNKKLQIMGGDTIRYTIVELSETELILGADGVFMIFRRIN